MKHQTIPKDLRQKIINLSVYCQLMLKLKVIITRGDDLLDVLDFGAAAHQVLHKLTLT